MKVIKDINFVPDYVWEKHEKVKKQAIIFMIVVIILAIIIGCFAAPIMILKTLETDDQDLSFKLIQLSDVQQKVNSINSITKDRENRRKIISTIEKGQIKVADLIDKINASIPSNVSVKTYGITGNSLNISFTLTSPLDIINLISCLESLNIFEKVDISSLPIVDTTAIYTISFSLKIKNN